MATFLDTGALAYFLPIFVFIFVFTAMFALLEKTKLLGSKTLNVAAALSMATLSLFTGQFTSLVAIIMPWVIFLFVILFLIFALFGFFEVKNKDIWDIFGHTPIFVLILIIVIVGISIVFDSTLSPYSVANPQAISIAASASGSNATQLASGDSNVRAQTIRTITHPRILGALFTLIVAAGAMRYLADKYVSEGK